MADGGGAMFDAYAHERIEQWPDCVRRECDDFVIEESVQPFAPYVPEAATAAPEPIPPPVTAAPEPDFVAWHEQRAASGAVWEEEPVEEEDDGPTPHSDDDDDDGLREKPGFRLASDPSIHWRSGSKVSALDKCNVWCDAVVTDERGQGSSRQLRVHYSGWNKRFDDWLFVSGGRLRAPPVVRRLLPPPRARTTLAPRKPAAPASHYRSRHRHPCLTRSVAPRRATPARRRAPHDFLARAVRDDTVPGAASAGAAGAAARRRRRRRGTSPPVPGRTQVSPQAAPARGRGGGGRGVGRGGVRPGAGARFGAERPRSPPAAGGEAACSTAAAPSAASSRPPPRPAHLRAGRQAPAPREEGTGGGGADPRPNHHAAEERPRARARSPRWRYAAR